MLFHNVSEVFQGQKTETEIVHGLVVLMKKNVLDLNEHKAAIADDVSGAIGNIFPLLDKQGLSFQLVSAIVSDPENGNRGEVGEKAHLEDRITTLPGLAAGELQFPIKFKWGEDIGVPGAVIVNNHLPNEFYLKSITLPDLNGKGQDLAQGSIHFNCHSWVYPVKVYKSSRIFFANNTYLPSCTPEPLRAYRDAELVQLRGDNVNCELKEHHRVYRYAYYNDLGKPEEGEDSARPVLGGSQEYPYPRRGRTGRRPSAADPHSESRLNIIAGLDIYVPRDERFGHLKFSDFLAFALESFAEGLLPGLKGYLTHRSFDTFEEVLALYRDGLPLPDIPREFWKDIPFELVKETLRFDGNRLSFPVPQVIQEDPNGWRNDEEFGRQMVAGLNPVIIQRLKEFPPTSKLDPEEYGNHESSITAADIIKNMDGLTVDQALEKERLFILDHHDTLMPYLNSINTHTNNKIYATRTLLFLKDDCTLKPIAIELSLPHMKGEQHGAFSKVYTPPKLGDSGVQKSIWELAKAFVAVNDSGVHQLISHWLNTHAVMEPFVIATNRQLSVIHPIHKLLSPHFRDTMNINAMARQILISAGGVLEMTVFPGRFAMEMSSVIYKDWKLTEQGLPDDLLKRGLAVEDHSKPQKLRLLIEDYPYAVDGLAIWSAIETWVTDYCSIYYPDDASVGTDNELQAWWKEIREVGHGDKKDESWWPKMQSVSELNKIFTTIIWVGSALHAAVNFGQYPYAGYLPNRPTLSRRLMPKEGSPEYKELMSNPDKVFLHTITGQFETVVGVGLIEILSRHSSDEVYLGQRNSSEWTSDKRAKDAFYKFQQNLIEIEKQIIERNNDKKLKNRRGPVNVPYTLLYPNTSDTSREGGLTVSGIPNSVSI